jgi:GTPase SAR1 family protein
MAKIESDDIYFPETPELKAPDMRRMKWLIYGPPGIGKSTFVSQAKDVLFLTTDGGLKFISSMHRPIPNWSTFKKYVRALQAEKPKQYKAIAIDVVGSLFKMCRKYVCDKRGIEHQSDEQWGKAYDLVSSEFELEIEKIVGLDKYGIFFISHSVEKEVKTRLSNMHKTIPDIPGQVYKIIHPMVDIMAFLGFDGKMTEDGELSRRMYFQPTDNLEAKDRTTQLPESLVIPAPEDGNGFEVVENYLLEPPAKRSTKKKIILRRK